MIKSTKKKQIIFIIQFPTKGDLKTNIHYTKKKFKQLFIKF